MRHLYLTCIIELMGAVLDTGLEAAAITLALEWLIPAVAGGTALVAAILSTVAGLGGGAVLLAVMAQFYAPTVAIPVQGSVQVIANSARAVMLRSNISWPVAGWAALPLLPASLLGAMLAAAVPVPATRVALGVFLLVVIWWPGPARFEPAGGISRRGLVGVGAVSGFLNASVGASGPFTSPFFRAATATHIGYVATASTSQIAANASKVVAHGASGFAPLDYTGVILAGAVGATIGTLIGTRLLGRVSEVVLGRTFRTVLTLLAVRLIVVGVF